jgi:hypothetical protein
LLVFLFFLAGVSLLSGCGCVVLWLCFVVPCVPTVSSCPDGFPLTSADMTGGVIADMTGTTTPPSDGSLFMSTDMSGPATHFDMNMGTPNDMGPPDLGIPDLGIPDSGVLDMDGFLTVPDAGISTPDMPILTLPDGSVMTIGDLGIVVGLK